MLIPFPIFAIIMVLWFLFGIYSIFRLIKLNKFRHEQIPQVPVESFKIWKHMELTAIIIFLVTFWSWVLPYILQEFYRIEAPYLVRAYGPKWAITGTIVSLVVSSLAYKVKKDNDIKWPW